LSTSCEPVVTLPPAENPATVIYSSDVEEDALTLRGVEVAVVGSGPVERVDNLPAGDVIVPLAVVSALREMRQRHPGRVYTPERLVMGENRKPLGTRGLIRHRDVEA
jgi:hypothetical protein